MPNSNGNRGGSHEQHVKAGQQSHKNDSGNTDQSKEKSGSSKDGGPQGGSREQNAKAGQQSRKNS